MTVWIIFFPKKTIFRKWWPRLPNFVIFPIVWWNRSERYPKQIWYSNCKAGNWCCREKFDRNRTSAYTGYPAYRRLCVSGRSYTDSGNFNNGAYAGASLVNIPLFYNYSPEIQNAVLKLKQAELKYESSKNRAVKDVSAAYDRFFNCCW